jgi:hypothetical protein
MAEHCTRGCKRTDYQRNAAVLGLALLIVVSGLTMASAQVSDAFVPSSLYDEVELMPYPTLAGPVSLYAVGPSGEFTCSQEIESASSGSVILNWTHTPGVELHYDNSSYFPTCMEYAYFAENFSYSQNTQPAALKVSANLQIKETGSFLTDSWSNMFYVQIWLLGDTIQKDEVAYAYTTQGNQHFSVSTFSYRDAFDALIQHPGSHLQFAIALVPTWYFIEYQGTHPWMNYTGSVEVATREIHLTALCRKNPDLPHIRTSTFNNTWRLGESDNFVDSCVAGDSSLYILSHQQFSNYIQGDTITKIDSKGKQVWRKSLNSTNSMFWSRVLATSNSVFLVGTYYYNTEQVVAVDTIAENGAQSHAFILNLTGDVYVGGIDISSDAYFYIVTSGIGSGKIDTLLKVSLDGSVLWTRQFGDDSYGYVSSVQIDASGNLFTFSQGQIIKWNTQGDELWELDNLGSLFNGAMSLYVLGDGSCILVASQLRNSTVACLDPQGDQQWSFANQIQYTPDWTEAFYVTWITESPSGLLYALYTTYDLHQSSIVVVMNRDGLQIENFTVSFGNATYLSANVPNYRRAYITANNAMYLVGRTVNEDNSYALTLSIYDAEPGTLGGPEVALLSTSVAAGVIVGVLVYLEHRNKHRMLS